MVPKGPEMCPEIALHPPEIHLTPRQGKAGPGGAAAPRLEAFDKFTTAVTSWLRDADVPRLFQSGMRPDTCTDRRTNGRPVGLNAQTSSSVSAHWYSMLQFTLELLGKNKRTKPVWIFFWTLKMNKTGSKGFSLELKNVRIQLKTVDGN